MTWHPERLLPTDPNTRAMAQRLYERVKDAPIISPHGHTDPAWFARNEAFPNPAALFIQPDHYIFRMLYSQGIPLEALGISQLDGSHGADPREVWRLFARNYFLFRGTPTRLWLDYSLAETFGLGERLNPANADHYYDVIAEKLATPEFRPRALFEKFRIEVLATTDAATDTLAEHLLIRESNWSGRVIPSFRPDSVVDPDHPAFAASLSLLAEQTGEDVTRYSSYLDALRKRRAFFKSMGATATDHGHRTARTADLGRTEVESLFARVVSGKATSADAEMFRAQMLTEMAGMSIEDGLTMQLHPGSFRDHNEAVFQKFGKDKGADIPLSTDYVNSLKPLLDKHGNERDFTFILFTLDETAYSRELAPMAGVYPCLRLGPPWWFHDSPEGMMRYREQVSETAGFYNTVGFNDDTRAFLSIPARHDVARRVDCAFLAKLVAEGRLDEDEAAELIHDLTTNLVKNAYKL